MESLVHILLSNALAATVIAVVAAALGRICRRPALTHGLWLVVLLKLVTPPLVPVSLPITSVVSPVGSSPAASRINFDPRPAAALESPADVRVDESTPRHLDDSFTGAQADLAKTKPEFVKVFDEGPIRDMLDTETSMAPGLTSGWTWKPIVLIVVLAGALGWWTLAAVRIIQFQRILKDVQSSPAEWQSHIDELARRMGLSWCPAVCLVPGRVPPMLWAIGGQPRLLVPSKLWTNMGDDERTSLLLHELAHLKRHDHWVRWLELVVAGLYWWHPVTWWARRALREAEEQCCDAWVVWAMPDRARTYAAALLAAVEFVSGARTAPAVASATSGSGHVSCLTRRLKMIVRAKTPKGLSWAGRIAVLGMAALFLPLAPSWAQKSESEQATKEQNESLRQLVPGVKPDVRQTLVLQQQLRKEIQNGEMKNALVRAQIESNFRKDPDVLALKQEIENTREHLELIKRNVRQAHDAARVAAQNHFDKLQREYNDLWESKYPELLAALTKDKDDDKDDDKKEEKTRDAAERLQEQLKDLIGKLGKELSPVAEEVRKALEQAVGEVHKSLEKDGLSAEELGKALERSQENLRKAFEGGGPVDKELREAIEKGRKDMEEAFDRARGDAQDQVESLRQRSRELRDQARENFDRARGEAERRLSRDGDEQPNRDELESARKEIRDLQQQLRAATRRLEVMQQLMQQRESRRSPAERRERTPNTEPQPQNPATPLAEPATPETPKEPAVPATPARPARPNARRPSAPIRPAPGVGRRGPQIENDRRLHELEDKMNQLLKELKNLKEEKSPKEIK
jgi:beta-lactamase regulating signal transducer with metallopeptidase domain